MAALLPLLAPQIIAAGVNIGIGITNAIEGDSSAVSLQIGHKVFTTKKPFKFNGLPPELRAKIIYMAMEESKDLILPTPYFFDPTQPLSREQLRSLQLQHPLNPESKHYRSIVGDRVSANGYPISTWRWATVSTEWMDIVRARLWKRLEVLGYRPYYNLIQQMESKEGLETLRHAQSLTFREGFRTASDLYTILSNPSMVDLEEIAILPDYPTSFHQLVPPVVPFPFGIQLIRTVKPIKSLVYGLPLELTTNSTSRQQLRVLRPPRLTLSFSEPTVGLLGELRDLVAETTDVFTIRYTPLRRLVSHEMFLSEPLQAFRKIYIYLHLPRPRMVIVEGEAVQDLQSPTTLFVDSLVSALTLSSVEVQDRYAVWNVEGWDAAGQVQNATHTRIWPIVADVDPTPPDDLSANRAQNEDEKEQGRQKDHWERETSLKLFGGLLNLSLESKKYRGREG